MKELTKEQIIERNALVDKLREDADYIDKMLDSVNREIFDRLNPAIQSYNDTLEEAKKFVDNLVDQMNSYKEDQPERWTESTMGVAFADWTDEWEAIDLDPIPDAEPLDPIHADHADYIENAQTEPSE